jgi:dephospho-CoA kinase
LVRIIGLTGGIATGKSTVADYLAQQYHWPILDADLYSRSAVLPDTEGLSAIVDRYGSEILLADQTLNRAKLGEIIFAYAPERQWLESIIHPYVRQCFERDLAPIADTAVAVVPLLFEANLQNMVSETWVVTCHGSQQLDRLQTRNNLTRSQAQARIKSQMPLAAKVRLAQVVLDNSGTKENLIDQINQAALLPPKA